MKTTIQTVDLTLPGSHMTFQMMSACPLPPPEIADRIRTTGKPHGLKTAEAYYYWFPDGRCEVRRSNGNSEVYWPPPSIQEAISYGRPVCDCCPKTEPGGFFQFHMNGALTCNVFGGKYYWSAPFESQPIGVAESGNQLFPYWKGGAWVFDYNDDDLIEQKWENDYDGYSSDGSYHTYDSDGVGYRYRRGIY